MSAAWHFKSIFSLLIPLLCAVTVRSTRQFHQSFLSISESLTSLNSIDNVAATNSATKVTRNINSLNVVKTIPRDGLTFTYSYSLVITFLMYFSVKDCRLRMPIHYWNQVAAMEDQLFNT